MSVDYVKEPFIISKTEPFYKIIAVILSFMEKNIFYYPLQHTHTHTDFVINFSKRNKIYFVQFYKNDQFGSMSINYTKRNITITFKNVYNECNIIGEIKLTCQTIDSVVQIPNLKQVFNKIFFYETHGLPLIHKIIDFKHQEVIKIQINEFYKIKNYTQYIDNKISINKKNINHFIEVCKKIKKEQIKINIGPIKINYNYLQGNYTLNISLGGILIVKEVNLNKYKYLNLPELNIIIKLINETNLKSKINNQIIKHILQKV